MRKNIFGYLIKIAAIFLLLIEVDKAGFCQEWTWMNPLPQGNDLLDVYCASDTNVFAVGANGTIMYYDGSSWSHMISGTLSNLNVVWGNSSTDIFAVGNNGTFIHYDGLEWSPAINSSTTNPYSENFTDVWDSKENGTFVLGNLVAYFDYYYRTYYSIDRYKNGIWENMLLESTPLHGIWGASSSNAFAVGGNGKILNYDGNIWYYMNSNTTANLYDVWGSSESDVFAVGNGGTILHYDGSTWSKMTSNTTASLYSIWGRTGNDVYVTGSGGVLLHYDGNNWSQLESKTANTLYAVDSYENCIFVVGEDGTILHFDGNIWNNITKGETNNLFSVWGSGSSDVFAVGDSGTILHYDGLNWISIADNTTNSNLRAVWGSSSHDVFAVGDSGTILHYDGLNWTSIADNTTNSKLRAVWGSSSHDVFAVGDSGTILHYDGLNWTKMASGTSNTLRGIWGSSYNNVYAVGDNGTIIHYGGKGWTPIVTGITNDLFAVWGSSANDVYMAGVDYFYDYFDYYETAILFHYNGSNFDYIDYLFATSINGIWGSSYNNIYLVGAYIGDLAGTPDLNFGAIFHGSVDGFNIMNSNTDRELRSVWGSSSQDVFAVGDGGTILHYDGTNVITTTTTTSVPYSTTTIPFVTTIPSNTTTSVTIPPATTTTIPISTSILITTTTTSALINRQPYKPSNPTPFHGATNVPLKVMLSWDGGDPDNGDHVTYDVYFGTGTEMGFYRTTSTGQCEIDDLKSSTTYKWKVVARDNHGEITEGPIWAFTTQKTSLCISEVALADDLESLNFLRQLRDEVLARSAYGRAIIKLYYEKSPKVVELLHKNPKLKSKCRMALKAIITSIKKVC